MHIELWYVLIIVGLTLATITFILLMSIVTDGSSTKHHHHNISISKCIGNHTGMQFTEGNITGNPSSVC